VSRLAFGSGRACYSFGSFVSAYPPYYPFWSSVSANPPCSTGPGCFAYPSFSTGPGYFAHRSFSRCCCCCCSSFCACRSFSIRPGYFAYPSFSAFSEYMSGSRPVPGQR
jgi:hypothetical protein